MRSGRGDEGFASHLGSRGTATIALIVRRSHALSRLTYGVTMSNAVGDAREVPHGTSLLPNDLTTEQQAAAPTLVSVDALLIEELTDTEDEAFASAMRS